MSALLILRPEPGATTTAARARALGFAPIIAPLFKVLAIDWVAPDPTAYDCVMLTSAQAARLGGAQLAQFAHLPTYTVGVATAAAARAAGFVDVRSGDGNVKMLLQQIAADGCKHVLHLTGEHHQDTGAETPMIDRRIVYAAQGVEPPPVLPATPIVLIHSPRAAARLAEIIPTQERASRTIIAISAAAARVAGAGWAAIHIAAAPNDDGLLARAAEACKTMQNKK